MMWPRSAGPHNGVFHPGVWVVKLLPLKGKVYLPEQSQAGEEPWEGWRGGHFPPCSLVELRTGHGPSFGFIKEAIHQKPERQIPPKLLMSIQFLRWGQ